MKNLDFSALHTSSLSLGKNMNILAVNLNFFSHLVNRSSFLLLCLFSLSFLSAQENSLSVKRRKISDKVISQSSNLQIPESYVKVNRNENFLRNDSLFLKFSVILKGSVVDKDQALNLVPEYTQNSDVYEFPPIRINGKKRAAYYRRERALSSPADYLQNTPYAIAVSDEELNKEIIYDYALPLPSIKSIGQLVLKYFKEDCCDILLEKTDSLSLERKEDTSPNSNSVKFLVVGYPEYQENVTYLEPKEEKEKIRKETIIIRINYPLDKWKVLPQFAGNELELSRIDEWFGKFNTDTYQIQSGSIIGYASPEATYDYNLKLSDKRAQGFYDYFLRRYGTSNNLPEFTVRGAGEDWIGLEKAIKETNMRYKNQVLQIIYNYGIFEGREKRLMDLAGGEPYKYMLQVFFPSLRRMELTLQYKVRSFKDQELNTVWQQRPQDLSQKELYTIAEQNKNPLALETAATYFPKDITANINASSAALIRGDLEKAYEYLQKVWNEPKAFNNIGVYFMLRKEYDKARFFFEKAKQLDTEKASANLQLLKSLEK